MSNLLLRSLREDGVVLDAVLPCARAKAAVDLAQRFTERTPDSPRTVIVIEQETNTGHYWVVSEADAQRLEAKGYLRYVTKPEDGEQSGAED